MKQNFIKIGNIPAIIWGEDSENLIVAVHGNLSNKADTPIEILAEHAAQHNHQVLSFDLPEHGDRKNEDTLCKVQICVKELSQIMEYAKKNWKHINLFANSMGAYFSLLAYHNEPIKKAWFLSPVVDMQRIITNMMSWFEISEEQLKTQQTVPTPVGQNLYWDYYSFVNTHPITDWKIPTFILYGDKDDMCESDIITKFKDQFRCNLNILKEGEHYFHTPEQLDVLNNWLKETLS